MIVFDYRLPSAELRAYVRQFQLVGFQFAENHTVLWKPYWPRPEHYLSFYPRKMEIIEYSNGIREARKARSSLMGQPLFMTKWQPDNIFFCSRWCFSPAPCTGLPVFRPVGLPTCRLTRRPYFRAQSGR